MLHKLNPVRLRFIRADLGQQPYLGSRLASWVTQIRRGRGNALAARYAVGTQMPAQQRTGIFQRRCGHGRAPQATTPTTRRGEGGMGTFSARPQTSSAASVGHTPARCRCDALHAALVRLRLRPLGCVMPPELARFCGPEQLEAADPKRQPVRAAASSSQPQPRSPRILRQRSRRGAPSALRSRQGTRRCAWKTRPCDEGSSQALGFRLYGPLCAALFSLALASGR